MPLANLLRARRIACVLVVVAGPFTSAAAQRGAPRDSARLQRTLDSARTAMGVPGASATLVFRDGSSWTGASGIATGTGARATPAHLWEVGSISKTVVAALVLDLAATGRLSLDDSLTRWVPSFPHAAHARGVTIRQLLQHTSGLHNYSENPEYVPALRADFSRVWMPEDSYTFMKAPYFAPGAGWHYSSANYLLLGQVVERVTGAPLARALRDRLFDPLKLASTFYGATEEVRGNRAHAFLDINGDGKPEDFTSLVPNTSFISAAGAAGAIVTTSSDLARLLHALGRAELVRGRWWNEMTRWVERGDGMQYGLGIIRYIADADTLLGHKGNSVGYSATAWHSQRSGTTIVVLTNQHATDVTPIARAMLRAQ